MIGTSCKAAHDVTLAQGSLPQSTFSTTQEIIQFSFKTAGIIEFRKLSAVTPAMVEITERTGVIPYSKTALKAFLKWAGTDLETINTLLASNLPPFLDSLKIIERN